MSRTVCVHAARSGTGKSMLAANLAAQLTVRGHRVVLVETNLQTPGLPYLFGTEHLFEPTLNDYLWGTIPIAAAARDVTEVVARLHPVPAGGSLHLLTSSVSVSDPTRILPPDYDVARLTDGLRAVQAELEPDYLLIDTESGLTEESLLSIAVSDLVLLVLRPDHQDFAPTANQARIAERLGSPALAVVLSGVPSSLDVDDMRHQLTDAYGVRTLMPLRFSEEIVARGGADLYSLAVPDDPWSAQVRAIADLVESADVTTTG